MIMNFADENRGQWVARNSFRWDSQEARDLRVSQAVDALNARSGRIGVAFATGSNGITAQYGVYADDGETLLVEYEGWSEGSVQHGLSGRAQPVRHSSARASFSEVRIFGEGR